MLPPLPGIKFTTPVTAVKTSPQKPTWEDLSHLGERIGDYALSENHSRRHGRHMLRILKFLVGLRDMKLFAPLALAAPLITSNQPVVTSNHLRGE